MTQRTGERAPSIDNHRIIQPYRTMSRSLAITLLLVSSLAVSPTTAGEARIRAFEEVAPTVVDAASAAMRLEVAAYGRIFALSLEPNVAALDGLGAEGRTRASRVADFYRGEVLGEADSWVRMARIEGRWTGAWFDGRELYLLDPAPSLSAVLSETVPRDASVVYRFSDLDLGRFCGIEHGMPFSRDPRAKRSRYLDFAAHLARGLAAQPRSAVRQLRVTLVTDTEFTATHGVANRDAVVAARMAVVDGIYSNQVGTEIGIRHVEHLSSNGTLDTNIGTGSDGLLNRFRVYMTSGAGSGIPKGGLNHLLTGKDLAIAGSPPNFGLAGIAYLDVLCNDAFGYGLDEVRANNNIASLIIAHEMGHNFDSPHDGNDGSSDQRCIGQTGSWLMSPSINGSSTFSPCTLAIVNTAIANAPTGCFVAPSGGDLIFRNGFEP